MHDYVYLILYAKIILTKHSHDYMSTVSMLPVFNVSTITLQQHKMNPTFYKS